MYFDYPFRDLQEEVVSNLVINIHKFDSTRGSKAFSYFSIIAKNYLILNNNANYKKLKIHDNIDALYDMGIYDDDVENKVTTEIFKKTINYFDDNLNTLFPKKNDRNVAESILYLCKNKDAIDNFNKKALYIMIREMTGVKTLYITKVVNTIKRSYQHLYPLYAEYGSLFRIPLKHLK